MNDDKTPRIRCRFCGARLIRDAIGQKCPTKNCQWEHGFSEDDEGGGESRGPYGANSASGTPIRRGASQEGELPGRAGPSLSSDKCPKCKGPKDHPEGSSACNRILIQKKSDKLSRDEVRAMLDILECADTWLVDPELGETTIKGLAAHDNAMRAEIRMLKLREQRLKGLAKSWQQHAVEGLRQCVALREALLKCDEQADFVSDKKGRVSVDFPADLWKRVFALLKDDGGGGESRAGNRTGLEEPNPVTAPSSGCEHLWIEIGRYADTGGYTVCQRCMKCLKDTHTREAHFIGSTATQTKEESNES